MRADRGQFAAEVAGERGRGQQRLTQGLAQPLGPAHRVERRTDHGEVEAALPADVAVHHTADIERDAELERCGAGRDPCRFAAARALRAATAAASARWQVSARAPADRSETPPPGPL